MSFKFFILSHPHGFLILPCAPFILLNLILLVICFLNLQSLNGVQSNEVILFFLRFHLFSYRQINGLQIYHRRRKLCHRQDFFLLVIWTMSNASFATAASATGKQKMNLGLNMLDGSPTVASSNKSREPDISKK